jgi:hypothetical protein
MQLGLLTTILTGPDAPSALTRPGHVRINAKTPSRPAAAALTSQSFEQIRRHQRTKPGTAPGNFCISAKKPLFPSLRLRAQASVFKQKFLDSTF